MKCVILFVAFFGMLTISQTSPLAKGDVKTVGLDEIFKGVVSRLPLGDLQVWFTDKYQNDKDFQKFVRYIRDDHFAVIDQHIQSNQWQWDFLMYIQDSNIDIMLYIKVIRDFFGLPPMQPPTMDHINSKAKPEVDWDLLRLLEEFKEIVDPYWGDVEDYLETVEEEPALVEFVGKLKSDECKSFALDYLGGLQEFKEFIEILEEGGLAMKEFIEWIKEELEWN